MAHFAHLIADIEAEPDLQARIERLVRGLAERIKTTSNDQNVQRLARDLSTELSDLVRAVSAKANA